MIDSTITIEPTLNLDLLNQILNLIDTNPGKWTQGEWIGDTVIDAAQKQLLDAGQYEVCGTQACVAGWAMLLSREYAPKYSPSRLSEGHWDIEAMVRVSDKAPLDRVALEIGKAFSEDVHEEDVYEFEGARLLGLGSSQAHEIFVSMEYKSWLPHTFTDQVRNYLGLDTKWGAKFSSCGEVRTVAIDELEAYEADKDDGY